MAQNVEQPLRLMLLPPPPTRVSISTFRAAYGPAIVHFLGLNPSNSLGRNAIALDVAVFLCKDEVLQLHSQRSNVYYYCQHIVGVLYRLYGALSIEKAAGRELENEVDIRIILVDGSNGFENSLDMADDGRQTQGPIVSLKGLAQCSRPWNQVYSSKCAAGEDLLQEFVNLRRTLPPSKENPSFEIVRLPGGTSLLTSTRVGTNPSPVSSKTRHYSVAVGGTFDHFHAGHKLLLTATALVLEPYDSSSPDKPRCLTIGITGDELLRDKKFATVMESWDERQNTVYQFLCAIMNFETSDQSTIRSEQLDAQGPNGKAVHHTFAHGLIIKCVQISDPFGPTITEESISALVISGETRAGGKAVNDKRTGKGWSTLEVFEVDVLDARSDDDPTVGGNEDFQNKISSTEIRRKIYQKSLK